VVVTTQNKVQEASAELLASQEINKEVDGGVESGQDAIGEDMEDHAPYWRSTDIDLLLVIKLINIKSNPGHVAEDEDGHNEEQDGGVGGLLSTALAGVDGNEHPNIEEYEEEHGHKTKDKESCPVLIVDNIVLAFSHKCQPYHGVIFFIVHYLTFKKFRSIYEDSQPQHREYVATQVPGITPVPVNQGVEDSQVPLYGDGDGHEDAAGEEDVVEGVEEVGEEMVVDLGGKTTEGSGVGFTVLKRPADTLGDTDNKEEEIKYCESNEKVVEVALECFVAEDTDGEDVGTHPQGGQHDSHVPTHYFVNMTELFIQFKIKITVNLHSILTIITHY